MSDLVYTCALASKVAMTGAVEIMHLQVQRPATATPPAAVRSAGEAHDYDCSKRVGGKRWEGVFGHH